MKYVVPKNKSNTDMQDLYGKIVKLHWETSEKIQINKEVNHVHGVDDSVL